MAASRIPVIDCKQGTKSCKKEIIHALKDGGFVFLKNTSIPDGYINEIFKYSKDFWLLEESIRTKYARQGKLSNNGYVSVGVECLEGRSIRDLKQAFNISPYQTNPAYYPDELPGFKTAVENLMQSCCAITKDILEILCEEFSDDDQLMLKAHKGTLKSDGPRNGTTLRLLHYPPISKEMLDGSPVMRCGEHADYGSLTFLFQDDVGGLEVQSRAGDFIPVTPVQGTVLLNTGSLMAHWTSNRIQAVKHRIRIPATEELRQTPRYSIAYFIHPDDGFLISPLDRSDAYKAITAGDYMNSKFSTSY